MFPADKLWPINEHWNFHAGGGEFKTVDVHTAALEARYGKASDAVDYTFKSQLMAYEGIRAMFEAFSRNKYTCTGLIQWMLNNAWPGIIWHLYDYYLLPGGGYFGAKVANQPLLPLYSYPDGSIWAVNSTYQPQAGLTLSARVLNLDMTEKFAREVPLELPPDGTKQVLTLPPIDQLPGLSPTYFLQLIIKDASGKQRGSQLLLAVDGAREAGLREDRVVRHPGQDLRRLHRPRPVAQGEAEDPDRAPRARATRERRTVRLHNPSKSLAFFVRLKVNKGKGGDEVLPVLWEDNYVSLLPGEKREIAARYRVADLGGKRPEVELQGWNLAR